MDSSLPARYKEVPLLQQSIIKNKRKHIDVTCGDYHTMLVDSKTSELSGGFNFDGSPNGRHHATRFIHWRTLRETIYLSEICLHRNDVCHEVKITFKGSPILSVDVHIHLNSVVFILITTTTSFHRIPLKRPTQPDHHLQIEQNSVILKLDENILTDPMNCYTFINDIGQSLPLTGAAMHCNNHGYSKFSIATSSSLYLFTMGGDKPDVKFVELEHNSLSLSKFIHHIADSWRRKTHTSQVVTMCFSKPALTEHQSLLYTLHRDGALRVWLHCGRFLAAEYLSKYTQGNEAEFHSCVLRRSTSLVGLFFSFPTFSEFVILRPILTLDENIGTISSVVLQNVCTILSPNYDLIDFKLCDQSLWSLWCNSQGEMQTLAYDLTTKDVFGMGRNGWLPVVMENITENYESGLDSSTDLRDVYCNRIFHSGHFPDKVIRKTLTMFNRNLAGIAGSSTTGSMVRLKRYVLACIENQLQQEQATLRQNGPFDDEQLIEISNGLWEKFYLYCTQYKYESSRPVGLFLIDNQMDDNTSCITAGMVRKKFVSFFRTCDWVEVAFYTPTADGWTESHEKNRSIDGTHETLLLAACLGEIEQILTQEQKHELNSYVHQRHESGIVGDDLLLIRASQNHSLIHNLMPAFLQKISNLTGAVGGLLEWLKPSDQWHSTFAWQQKNEHHVSVYTSDELACELVLVTAKQTIQLRYILLRNLLLLQHIIQHHFNLPYDILDSIQSTLRPDTETMLRCYHVMNWIAQTRLDLDWTRTTKIAASFPMNLRTSMTLLQAYATHRLNDNLWLESSSTVSSITGNPFPLPLMKKANFLITYLSPSTDDFLFGEWLSDNDLHVYIDEYVRLLGDWCEWNCCSRNFIRGKSYLMLGDTSKALDLFPLSLKGIHSDRFLQKYLRQNDKHHTMSPYEILSAFYLRLIRLFEFYGAYDGVLTLVHSAIDNTIQQKQQAMFQSIEFSSHIELGHYEEAYNTLTKNCDLARKKDCLRQLICLLFSVRRLDVLMSLPCYGLEEEFTNIVAMNARSADVADSVQYDFLYSFYINKMNLRKAAITSYEEGMRNYIECTSYDHLNRYYRSLLKCLNSLAINKPLYAWILRPVMENKMGQTITTSTNGDEIEIVDKKDLHEQLMTTYCALQLSQSSDGFRLVTSLEPTELIALLLSKQMYHLALKLAHRRVRSMVPTIYEHITSACLVASNSVTCDAYGPAASSTASHSLSWLSGNCISDITVGLNIASTAWNYLRHMIEQEKVDAVNAHLAVLNRVISRGAHVPSWLKAWCFEHAPVKLIRTYMCHGRLEEAYECTVDLFKARFFSAGRFSHQTLFPLSVCEHLLYELCQTPKYSKEKEHIEQYLRIVEVSF